MSAFYYAQPVKQVFRSRIFEEWQNQTEIIINPQKSNSIIPYVWLLKFLNFQQYNTGLT